jgi:hypothetical protein
MSTPLSFDAKEYETSTANDVVVPVTALAGLTLVMLTLSIAALVSDEEDPPPHANRLRETIIHTTADTLHFFIFSLSFRKFAFLSARTVGWRKRSCVRATGD